MPQQEAEDKSLLDRPEVIATAVVFSFVSMAGFLVLPQLVEGVVTTLHFSERLVGWLSAVTAAGSMLSALGATFWVRKVSWRRAAYVTLAGIALANVVAMTWHRAAVFFPAEFLAGISGGSLYSLALTMLSDGSRPDRSFGYAVATQVAFQVVGLAAGPWVLRAAGLDGLLAAFALLAVAASALVRMIPANGRSLAAARAHIRHVTPATVLALCGCFLFFFNVGCYWTYVELIGTASGLTPQSVAYALSVGVGVGILGALLASWMGERRGRLPWIAWSALLSVCAALLLLGKVALLAFGLSAVLYNIAWNLSLTYQYSVVNAVDDTGVGVAAAPAFHSAGAAVGPAVAAVLIGPGHQVIVIWLVCFGVLASLACFAGAASLHGRHGRTVAACR
jgi:predicted MFS family arabinose efflux permease